jgi:hypothetical protein
MYYMIGAVVVASICQLDLQLHMQPVSITTNVVVSNATQAIQHYVIKFVSDLRINKTILFTLLFPNKETLS